MSLSQNFEAYSQWRSGVAAQVERFRRWLNDNDLNEAEIEQRLQQLLLKLREDRLTVAFVAEFSRGKSELINAIFFAGYGNRMLPSAAGRTTMCPTELLYDDARPATIELLPIQSRSTNASITEYKRFPDEWRSIAVDIHSAEAMQAALHHVSDVLRVPPEEAQRLGFSVGDDETTSFRIDDDGLVEIPQWRHAIINFPHPLLKQGLVVLDTPGLNAIGTEPELTLSLLPNAHAVLFILAADTGVTQSDLLIWRDYIRGNDSRSSGRLIVLNKIDGMWDELKKPAEVDAEISRQVGTCADILNLPEGQIFPVSAQKALVAKVTRDAALLDKSRILALERALASELVPAKMEIVRETAAGEFWNSFRRTHRVLDARLTDINEQLRELTGLRGKNKGVVEYMLGKVKNEKSEFETGLQRYYAVRSVFSTQTTALFSHLSLDSLRDLTKHSRAEMQKTSFSLGLSGAMSGFFAEVRDNVQLAEKDVTEIMAMMSAIYKKFAIEHGLKLGTPTSFSLLRYEKEIDRLERWCNTHLNTPLNLLTQEKRMLVNRFFEEVAVQVRRTVEHANQDAEIWIKAIMSPMETQVREHQVQLRRRLESIRRIHQATDTLDERIGELEHAARGLLSQIASLQQIGAAMEAQLSSAKNRVAAAAAA
jgi:hypothetical protein